LQAGNNCREVEKPAGVRKAAAAQSIARGQRPAFPCAAPAGITPLDRNDLADN
jgi:hypothetical protein